MEAHHARRAHRVRGDLAIAGKLTRQCIMGTFIRATGRVEFPRGEPAEVLCSDTATIQAGAWVVRTSKASQSHGREHTDMYVYIPFRTANGLNHCILKIEQILLVRRKLMGWRGNEARIATGILWERLVVRRGAGLETEYNDDPSVGACCVPRALHLSRAHAHRGIRYAVFLRQIHCPCVYIPEEKVGETFMTLSKMGFHGRRDLMFTGTMLPEEEVDQQH